MNVPMQIWTISKYFLLLWKSMFHVIISFTTKPWFLWWPSQVDCLFKYLHILQIQCTTKCYVCMGFGIYMFLMGDVFFMFTFILQIKDLFYLPCMYVEEFITILSAKAFIFPVFLLSQQQRKLFNGEWTYGHQNNKCYVYWCFGVEKVSMC